MHYPRRNTCALFCEAGLAPSNTSMVTCTAPTPWPQVTHCSPLLPLSQARCLPLSLARGRLPLTSLPCRSPMFWPLPRQQVLCLRPEDQLESGACRQLDTTSSRLAFIPSPLPAKDMPRLWHSSLLRKGLEPILSLAKPLASSYSWKTECLVKLDHSSLLLVGQGALLVVLTEQGVLSLALPRCC